MQPTASNPSGFSKPPRGLSAAAWRGKAWLCWLLSVAVLLLAGSAHAQPDDRREKIQQRMEQVVQKILRDHVGLDPAKAKQVEALLKQQRKEQHKLRAEMRKSRRALEALLEADSNDQKAYAAAMKAMRKASDDLHKLRSKHLDQMGKLLTPKQHAKLLQAVNKVERKIRRKMRRRE